MVAHVGFQLFGARGGFGGNEKFCSPPYATLLRKEPSTPVSTSLGTAHDVVDGGSTARCRMSRATSASGMCEDRPEPKSRTFDDVHTTKSPPAFRPNLCRLYPSAPPTAGHEALSAPLGIGSTFKDIGPMKSRASENRISGL